MYLHTPYTMNEMKHISAKCTHTHTHTAKSYQASLQHPHVCTQHIVATYSYQQKGLKNSAVNELIIDVLFL